MMSLVTASASMGPRARAASEDSSGNEGSEQGDGQRRTPTSSASRQANAQPLKAGKKRKSEDERLMRWLVPARVEFLAALERSERYSRYDAIVLSDWLQ